MAMQWVSWASRVLVCSFFGMSSITVGAAGFENGPVELQSAGPLAMTDDGTLLVGDPMAAVIYAIDTEEKSNESPQGEIQIDDLNASLAKTLGVDASSIKIADMVASPTTGSVYMSVSSGDERAIVRVSATGDVSKLNLDKVRHAKKSLPNPPENKISGEGRRQRNLRAESITDLAFFEGKVLVSGLSATEAPSSVMEMPYPFSQQTIMTYVEIFHAAHGRVEDPAIRTFVAMTINGEPNVLAGFTCTPLVAFPIEKMGSKEKVRGKTLAELGNRNQPLDMIPYEQDGKNYLLISNSARGTMKVSLEGVEKNPGLTEPVKGGGTAGQPFETIDALAGVMQMDRYNEDHIVVVAQTEGSPAKLFTAKLP